MRHGGDFDEAARLYGIPPDAWLDLSTGINPVPYPVGDPASLVGSLFRLPTGAQIDGLLAAARQAYAADSSIGIAAIPGSEMLIRALPRLVPGPVGLVDTSYRSYLDAFGGRLTTVPDAGAVGPETSIILVNPNNPDGRLTQPRDVLNVARRLAPGSVCVVDEAYSDAEPAVSVIPHLRAADPVLVLKSFGKFFGLPGLRLGFAVGAPNLVAEVARLAGDWPVSGPAIAIGAAALGDEAWQRQARHWLGNQAQALDSVLRKAGLGLADGCRLFRVVVSDDAPAVHERLARQGVWTRIFDDRPRLMRFGLPAGGDELKRLVAALAA